jgi:hypothetical protein
VALTKPHTAMSCHGCYCAHVSTVPLKPTWHTTKAAKAPSSTPAANPQAGTVTKRCTRVTLGHVLP